MVYHLTRISVWPVVKLSFIINGLIGLSFGAFYGLILAIIGSVVGLAGGDEFAPGLGMSSGVLGFLIAVVLGMIYGVFGASAAAFAVWLYNMLAGVIGGIELTLESVPEEVAAQEPFEPVPGSETPAITTPEPTQPPDSTHSNESV